MNQLINILLNATPIIKIIILGLILSSIWSWTIILHKSYAIARARRKMKKFEKHVWAGGTLDEINEMTKFDPNHPAAKIFLAGIKEWHHAIKHKLAKQNPKNLIDRMERIMKSTLNSEIKKLEENLGFLSALGTNGVIIGLFGTVLGIMNSFQAIALQKNTSIAIVAPGISEALFATAVGLIAAIPAAIFYNRFVFSIQSLESELDNFTQKFIVVISRQIDEQ